MEEVLEEVLEKEKGRRIGGQVLEPPFYPR